MFEKLTEITGGDAERMKVHFTFFIECIGENMEMLEKALISENLQEIRTVVHTSKPLFDSFEFKSMWDMANEIEQHIDGELELPDFDEKVQWLLESMKASLEELKKSSHL